MKEYSSAESDGTSQQCEIPSKKMLAEFDDGDVSQPFDARLWSSRAGQTDYTLLLLFREAFSPVGMQYRTVMTKTGLSGEAVLKAGKRCASRGWLRVRVGDRFLTTRDPAPTTYSITPRGVVALLQSPLRPLLPDAYVMDVMKRMPEVTRAPGLALERPSDHKSVTYSRESGPRLYEVPEVVHLEQQPSSKLDGGSKTNDKSECIYDPVPLAGGWTLADALFTECGGGLWALILVAIFRDQGRIRIKDLARLWAVTPLQVRKRIEAWERKHVNLLMKLDKDVCGFLEPVDRHLTHNALAGGQRDRVQKRLDTAVSERQAFSGQMKKVREVKEARARHRANFANALASRSASKETRGNGQADSTYAMRS